MHIRIDQWEWQKQRDVREGEKQKSPAAQVKFFGNVLKNVMPKFPSDVDVPIFFEGVEKLFQSFFYCRISVRKRNHCYYD